MLPLVIRAEQMRALRAPFLDGLADDATEHARLRHPDVVATLGEDGLATHIRAAIAEASAYDLASKRDLLRFVSLTLTFGLHWSDSPDRRWMHETLAPGPGAPADSSARLNALYLEVLARLSRGEMPEAENA